MNRLKIRPSIALYQLCPVDDHIPVGRVSDLYAHVISCGPLMLAGTAAAQFGPGMFGQR